MKIVVIGGGFAGVNFAVTGLAGALLTVGLAGADLATGLAGAALAAGLLATLFLAAAEPPLSLLFLPFLVSVGLAATLMGLAGLADLALVILLI